MPPKNSIPMTDEREVFKEKLNNPMQDLIKQSESKFINDIDNYVDYHGEADKEDTEKQKNCMENTHTKTLLDNIY